MILVSTTRPADVVDVGPVAPLPTRPAVDTYTDTVATTRQITKDEVLDRWATGPRFIPGCDWGDVEDAYVEPVTAFGIEIRVDEHPGVDAWDAHGLVLPALSVIDLSLIRYSTQDDGVLVSILAKVITNGTDTAPEEPEGCVNNEHPVLFGWPDGTYTIYDGNHRCIGGRLRGDTHIRAHVIPYDYSPTTAKGT